MDLWLPLHTHVQAATKNRERDADHDVVAAATRERRYLLRVDLAERDAALLDLARASGDFDIQMERLPSGDYEIDGGVIIERKTYADFATSLADGRLFPQAAALARRPQRPVILLEGPTPPQMPNVQALRAPIT